MRRDTEQQMLAAMPCGTLKAGHDTWRLYVLDTRRVDRDWFIRIAVVGARTHTIDVRARADSSHSATAQRVITAVRDWLQSGDVPDEAFLELPNVVEQAC
jgi:hypothetical protein